MADILPLISNKKNGEVRSLLREVFDEKELLFPALSTAPASSPLIGSPVGQGETTLDKANPGQTTTQSFPVAQVSSSAVPAIQELCKHHLSLKRTLHSPSEPLVPRCSSHSTGSLNPMEHCISAQSISVSEPQSAETSPSPPCEAPLPPPPPEHVVCRPPALSFTNFKVGQLYTCSVQGCVRLLNRHRAELRLSVRPLQPQELGLQLCGRLTLTPGQELVIHVLFRPQTIRDIRELLVVRVSSGRHVTVPIACYHVPPMLDLMMPCVPSLPLVSCEGEARGEVSVRRGRGAVLDLGAALLGRLHEAPLYLHCTHEHAYFFLMSSDAWLSQDVTVSNTGSVIVGAFSVSPWWWRGGGGARGRAVCAAPRAGLQSADLYLLSSTAIARPLTLIADAVYFHPSHVSISAQEKTYDILSNSDPACEFFVDLGSATPNQPLSSTVLLVNHSAVTYSFYWTVREWGVCSCDDEGEETCPDQGSWAGPACEGREKAQTGGSGTDDEDLVDERALDSLALGVVPLEGTLPPHGTINVHVAVPDAGNRLGTHRGVLMLILKDIPRKSFPPKLDPPVPVVSTRSVHLDAPPGLDTPRSLEVCDVVGCQLEVWWEVGSDRPPPPPALDLPYSTSEICGCDDPLKCLQDVVDSAYKRPQTDEVPAGYKGLEIEHWIPIGGNEVICLKRIEHKLEPWHEPLPATPEEGFLWDDRMRAFADMPVCGCKQRKQWMPPSPPAAPPQPGLSSSVEILSKPPSLTYVCECWQAPAPPKGTPLTPIAIEFRQLRIRTVSTQTVRVHNASAVPARWQAALRLGAMPETTHGLLHKDPWKARVRACGVAVWVCPLGGELPGGATAQLAVSVCADTWGVYRDQLLIMTERLRPLVVDVWVEAVGCPLEFPLRPNYSNESDNTPPVLWLSKRDSSRTILARNTSKAPLLVKAYVIREHCRSPPPLPFRLMFRMVDVPRSTCPCYRYLDQPQSIDNIQSTRRPSEPPTPPCPCGNKQPCVQCDAVSWQRPRSDGSPPDDPNPSEATEQNEAPAVEVDELIDTGVELFLAPDCGEQDHAYYKVEPDVQSVPAGSSVTWTVVQLPRSQPVPPQHTVLLRIQPIEPTGKGWFRCECPPAAVLVRVAERPSAHYALQTSHHKVIAHICALQLPTVGTLRVRKRIMVQNIASDTLDITASCAVRRLDKNQATEEKFKEKRGEGDEGDSGDEEESELDKDSKASCVQWNLVSNERHGQRISSADLVLPPNSATELILEAMLSATGIVPEPADGSGGEGGAGAGCYCATPPPPRFPPYPTRLHFKSYLCFYDDRSVVKWVPLCVTVERPALRVEPHLLDFGYVCDDDVRKTWFTVSHTSRSETLSLGVTWRGLAGFQLHPTSLTLAPEETRRIYVQYTAQYTHAFNEGYAEVCVTGGAGTWCKARVLVRAGTSRDFNCHQSVHDFTDGGDMPLPPPPPRLPVHSRLEHI